MIEVEHFFDEYKRGDIKTLFIVETSDTMMFNFHRDKLGITAPVVWDYKHLISEKEISFENNEMFLLDKLGSVILKGDFIYDKKQEYIEVLNNY